MEVIKRLLGNLVDNVRLTSLIVGQLADGALQCFVVLSVDACNFDGVQGMNEHFSGGCGLNQVFLRSKSLQLSECWWRSVAQNNL